MPRPTKTIRAIIQSILNGESFDHGLELLQERPRAAIRHLLRVIQGEAFEPTHSALQQREASDAAIAALCSVGASHPELLIGFLERSLVSGPPSSSFALTWALAHSDTTSGLPASAKALQHADRFVRWAACKDLARRRPDNVRALLTKASSDRASLVRSTAVEALIRAGDETSLPVLEKRLRDRYPGIRETAARAIDAIKRRTERQPRALG
jgi:hypothetical protein